MVHLSDETAGAARSGDPDALGTVWQSLSPRVLGYLRSRGVEDPEGLTSEVFLAVIPRLRRLRGGAEGLTTLVFSVAHARAVDDVRRRARRPAQSSYEDCDDPRTEPSAETTALGGVSAQGSLDRLARLSEDQRAVIALRVLGDLSLDQTARIVGKSTGAVKQLQRRGLLALRAMVEEGEVSL
jgi:RNA polymerase sigma-70 factor (ECF subfamily)